MTLQEFLDNAIKRIDSDYNAYIGSANKAEIGVGNIVYFSQTEIDKSTTYTQKFRKFLLDMWQDSYQFSSYTWAFLHEIGHLETGAMFLNENYIKYFESIMESLINEADEDEAYMRSPAERAATEWAVNFARSYQEEIKNV